ncbi:hypothetical protein [Algoriphagus sp. Y33]|uniref:hypothetical protein n=1 Tax=Algoriphagus sp. Y33 TaxID=2772483 RepID=UPI0017814BB7|nr:hypothetical protein [Algoriphagus sp. Y33]
MTYTKITTWFLAISMFLFGILKFINPFKSWYMAQVTNSGLGQLSYVMGIMGEIAVGLTLLVCLIYRQRIPTKLYALLTTISFFTIIIVMLTGVYVHLNPNVPADILPLKIKPPYIPIFFLLIALSNIALTTRNNPKARRVKRPNR